MDEMPDSRSGPWHSSALCDSYNTTHTIRQYHNQAAVCHTSLKCQVNPPCLSSFQRYTVLSIPAYTLMGVYGTMATVAVGDLLQVKVYCRLRDQEGINSLHFRVQAIAGTATTTNIIGLKIDNELRAAYPDVLADDASYQGVGIRRISPLPITSEEFCTLGAVSGNAGTLELPLQVSGVITFKTGLAGPSKRGRAYIPFPSTTDVDTDGSPKQTYADRLTAIWSSLIGGYVAGSGGNTATVQLIIYHRIDGTWTNVNSGGGGNKKWGTQRRRGDYGKPNVSPF